MRLYEKSCIHSQNGSILPWHVLVFGEGEDSLCPYESSSSDENSLDAIHSVYVDQWAGKSHPNGQRNIAYYLKTVEKIYKAFRLTELAVEARYDIESVLPKQITFVHTEED